MRDIGAVFQNLQNVLQAGCVASQDAIALPVKHTTRHTSKRMSAIGWCRYEVGKLQAFMFLVCVGGITANAIEMGHIIQLIGGEAQSRLIIWMLFNLLIFISNFWKDSKKRLKWRKIALNFQKWNVHSSQSQSQS